MDLMMHTYLQIIVMQRENNVHQEPRACNPSMKVSHGFENNSFCIVSVSKVNLEILQLV